MRNDVFLDINRIIEREGKSTTYKFALLRGVIDIIQDNSPYIRFIEGRVEFPTGLLVEKWILYYYPLLESAIILPQINGATKLAFDSQFKKIITAYQRNGGFSAFYNDFRNNTIPNQIQLEFQELGLKIKETITKMPMKYIGSSIKEGHYSIFQYEIGIRTRPKEVGLESMIKNFGYFSIPQAYFDAFRLLGSFINGQDSILFKWAEFSVKASGINVAVEKVVSEVLKSPITERAISESKNLYNSILKKEGKVYCVWTGNSINRFDVDHLIPFSVWKNNDLWNLLPSQSITNNKKRDKIPSVRLIEKRKDLIIHYWELIEMKHTQRFQREIQIALLGNISRTEKWQETAIKQLQKSCDYLITSRGYEQWDI